MKSNKEYRFSSNPMERKFHDKFIEKFKTRAGSWYSLSSIIFGWKNDIQNTPNKQLTDDEESICLNLIQWLGSPVGQSFLNDCGFFYKDNK